jgi:hypothetical protein
MHCGSPYVFIDQRKAKWTLDDSRERLMDRQYELNSGTSTPILVPPKGGIRLCTGFGIKYNLEFHDCGSNASRISAHGMACSGAARCLANRRRSSDRCSSVRVIASGTSATLSQRSPASAMRSSALSSRAASSSCLRDMSEYSTSTIHDFTNKPSDKPQEASDFSSHTSRNRLSMLR